MATMSGGKKELEAYLLNACKQACEFMSKEFYEALNYFLAQYYSEYTPKQYSREKDFLYSAFKTEVKKVGNGYQAVIGIDYESLDNYEDATGYQVVTWANSALHGGYDAGTDTHVWDDTIDVTINSGQLLAHCIVFLKGKGYKII